ncbi:hypothetical protein [Paenibacillus sp. LHD-38]|uniref:hypothetical protein n=1 Tax=Paenibacillus sp. LHD-38 TaxID=3072143 RepID=UPI00280C8697|nr:hypothetical protein [Paenibacillus sp. LHD-38]MDQ8735508.1 hypothetical protein [Paenibacillus sp. LHD-38]
MLRLRWIAFDLAGHALLFGGWAYGLWLLLGADNQTLRINNPASAINKLNGYSPVNNNVYNDLDELTGISPSNISKFHSMEENALIYMEKFQLNELFEPFELN